MTQREEAIKFAGFLRHRLVNSKPGDIQIAVNTFVAELDIAGILGDAEIARMLDISLARRGKNIGQGVALIQDQWKRLLDDGTMALIDKDRERSA